MSERALLDQLNVSRETIERLEKFEEVLLKWNPRINLVSKSSLADLWQRHIVDSVQVFASVEDAGESWVDIGSGGGFPGIVVAIMAAERSTKNKGYVDRKRPEKVGFSANCSAGMRGFNFCIDRTD